MHNIEWLVFSHSLPARSASGRVKVWRALQASGAVQVKGAVYMLPASDANREHLVWLIGDIEAMGGEAILFRCPGVETMSDEEIMAVFARSRDEQYDGLEAEIRAFLDGLPPRDAEKRELKAAHRRFARRLEAIREIDFFPSGRGDRVAALLEGLEARFRQALPASGATLDRAAYRGRRWLTREHPFVDRLASFWLVRRFIDPEARVEFFRDERQLPSGQDIVTFDVRGGDFTHRDGLITFEAMAEDFGLGDKGRDKGLEKLRRVIRAIDLPEALNDEDAPEGATAVRDILDGLAMTARDDLDLVDKALVLFDALYAAYSK